MLVNDLALLLDLFGNSEETKLLICKAIFVWCLQRHRNGGLNSGQKSAIIVTDAYRRRFLEVHFPLFRYISFYDDHIDITTVSKNIQTEIMTIFLRHHWPFFV